MFYEGFEGNTRSTAVFIIKYLKTFGFSVNNEVFAENYFSSISLLFCKFTQNLLISIDNTFLRHYNIMRLYNSVM